MDNREAVYLEKYVAAHNERLRRHPQHRTDMAFHPGHSPGSLVMQTRDRIQDPNDTLVFEEVMRDVASTHRLIV